MDIRRTGTLPLGSYVVDQHNLVEHDVLYTQNRSFMICKHTNSTLISKACIKTIQVKEINIIKNISTPPVSIMIQFSIMCKMPKRIVKTKTRKNPEKIQKKIQTKSNYSDPVKLVGKKRYN